MLRSGTGTKYKIIGKYKNGTKVVSLEKTTSSWYNTLHWQNCLLHIE